MARVMRRYLTVQKNGQSCIPCPCLGLQIGRGADEPQFARHARRRFWRAEPHKEPTIAAELILGLYLQHHAVVDEKSHHRRGAPSRLGLMVAIAKLLDLLRIEGAPFRTDYVFAIRLSDPEAVPDDDVRVFADEFAELLKGNEFRGIFGEWIATPFPAQRAPPGAN